MTNVLKKWFAIMFIGISLPAMNTGLMNHHELLFLVGLVSLALGSYIASDFKAKETNG